MKSPIENRIGRVFVPGRDMERAVEWYTRLLGLPSGRLSHGGTIYDLPMGGEVGLTLDATPKLVSNSSQPLCWFWTLLMTCQRNEPSAS